MPASVRPTIYLHIGAFKSGTTYLQTVLWQNRNRLAEDGVLIPGAERPDQGRAVRDVLNVNRWGEPDPHTVGAWDRLVAEVSQWSGSAAIVSMETLSGASPAQVRRIVSDLGSGDVCVLLSARDLARVIPASWQTLTRNGHSWTWAEFLSAIADPGASRTAPARGFWRKQDLPAILERWSAAVPPSRTQIVTVPPPGSPPALLWERFAAASGLGAGRYDTDLPRVNESLGAASAELLRRLNPQLREQVPWSVYHPVVTTYLGKSVLTGRAGEPRIAFDHRASGWVGERAEQMVGHIRAAGYPVVGDLGDLVPTAASAVEGVSPDAVPDAELLDAAMAAVVGLVQRCSDEAPERAGGGADPRAGDATRGRRGRGQRDPSRRKGKRGAGSRGDRGPRRAAGRPVSESAPPPA